MNNEIKDMLQAVLGRLDEQGAELKAIRKGQHQMEGEITQIKGDITHMKGDITRMQGDITRMQGDITRMQGDITHMKGDITRMQGDITHMKGDIIQMKGDISELKQGQQREEKIMEKLALRSIEQETNIDALKRAK